MKINIFGSTGVIGKKTLDVLDNNFNNIKVNLLCAKSNHKLLIKQIHKYKPKYAFLNDIKYFHNMKSKIGATKLLTLDELLDYLSSSRSDFSVLLYRL